MRRWAWGRHVHARRSRQVTMRREWKRAHRCEVLDMSFCRQPGAVKTLLVAKAGVQGRVRVHLCSARLACRAIHLLQSTLPILGR